MTDADRTIAEPSDRTLLRRFRAGEHDAATELYVRYARRLQGLARRRTGSGLSKRFDPEDVVQSVFRTFFRRAAAGLYDVPAGEQLWNLLLVLALNKVRKLSHHHGAQKRDVRRTTALPDADLLSQSHGRLSEDPASVLAMTVQETIEQLPDAQQAVVRLRIEGHEIAEIAHATGRSKRTVERVLQKFRQMLNRQIDEH